MKGYFKYKNRHIWYYKLTHENKSIFIFLDDALKNCEERDYLNRIETHPKAYSLEKFREKNFTFGSFTLLTSTGITAEEVYTTYKSRIEVELVAGTLKNLLDADKSYRRDEEALEG